MFKIFCVFLGGLIYMKCELRVNEMKMKLYNMNWNNIVVVILENNFFVLMCYSVIFNFSFFLYI